MRFLRFATSVIVCAGSTSFALAQVGIRTISVNDPRPLAAACEKIEALSGIQVSYEDAIYAYPGDLIDITEGTLTSAQRAAHPNARIVVPRGGSLSASIATDPISGKLLSIEAVQGALAAVIKAESDAFGQTFGVSTVGGMLIVVPKAIKNSHGVSQSVTAPLSTTISFPNQERTGYQTIRLILQQASAAARRKILIGLVPTQGLAQAKVALGANDETAESVVIRLLNAVSVTPAFLSSPSLTKLSYKILYDFSLDEFFLSIRSIPDGNEVGVEQPQSMPQAKPNGPSPFYVHPHK